MQKLKARQYPIKYLSNGIYKLNEEWKRANQKDKGSGKIPKYYIDVEGKRVFVGPRKSEQVWKRISGQDIYKGIPSHERSQLNHYLKDFYRPLVRKQLTRVEDYPIMIEFKIYTTVNSVWDPSNMWIYGKVFEDTLVEEGIISQDNSTYITYPPVAPLVIPVTYWENRRIEFHIKKDEREIVQNLKTV